MQESGCGCVEGSIRSCAMGSVDGVVKGSAGCPEGRVEGRHCGMGALVCF